MYLRPSAPDRPRIIVVDQDAATLSKVCDLLQSKGYNAIGVESASMACRVMHRRPADLVLTTITLPEEERRAWTAALNHPEVKVPVVAVCDASGTDALGLFDAANEFGAVAVLRRPFTATTLLQILADLLPRPTPRETAQEPASLPFDWTGLVSGSTAIH